MALSKNDILYLSGRLTVLKRRKAILQQLTSGPKNRNEIRDIDKQINNVKNWLKEK